MPLKYRILSSLLIFAVGALCMLSRSVAGDFNVTLTVRTKPVTFNSLGIPNPVGPGDNRLVTGAVVQFWDDDLVFDDLLGTGTTDSNGVITCSFAYDGYPDIYAYLTGEYTGFDGHSIMLRREAYDDPDWWDWIDFATPWEDAGPMTYTLELVTNATPGNYNFPEHLPDNRPVCAMEARSCISQVKTAYPAWTMTKDLRIDARDDSPIDISKSSAEGIHISYEDYEGDQYISNIHHETGHWMQQIKFPMSGAAYMGEHAKEVQSNETTTLIESWAIYVALNTAPPDHVRDLPLIDNMWNGYEFPPDGSPAGTPRIRTTGSDNAGDIVEGAVAQAWMEIMDFPGVVKALFTGRPWTNAREWFIAYVDAATDPAPAFEAFQRNGMVYTRAKLSFTEVLPSTTPDAANIKEIDGYLFTRGTVTPDITQLTKDDLRLAPNSSTIAATGKNLLYKTANEGLGDAVTDDSFTAMTEVAWGDTLSTDFGDLAEGLAYDIAVQTKNAYDWKDDLEPDWVNDIETSYNSDEKWLKHIQTWLDKDVVRDETAPNISSKFPQ